MKITLILIYLSLLSLLSHIHFTLSLSQKSQIHNLPGWDKELPSKMYSGYIPVDNNTKFVHYFFVEAFENPHTSPLAIWLQGGPGGSSFLSLFTEIGPFKLNQFSHKNELGVPKMIPNPYTWTKNVNYIFVEHPAGVGFSFCEDICAHTDETQVEDLYQFILQFMELYPEFKSNDFYVSGESYGGLYCPLIANKIMESENTINLKGIITGNGCTGVNTDGWCYVDSSIMTTQFLHGHSQISTKTYKEMMNCNNTSNCNEVFQKVVEEAGPYYLYDIYDECYFHEDNDEPVSTPIHDYPCYSIGVLTEWANNKYVKKLFETNKVWTNMQRGTEDGRWDQYIQTNNDVHQQYKKLNDFGVKITIYSGDVDSAVSYLGSELAANSMGLKEFVPRRPWTVDGYKEVAGYVEMYEKDFTFITVRGAGHMVPTNKPAVAEVIFDCFINNISLPFYEI